MGIPRRFIAPNDCVSCGFRQEGDFCHTASDALRFLNSAGHLTLYPAYAVLLSEGQIPQGVFIVCSGRVKLSVTTREGKTVIVRIAENRQVLGLSAIISGRPAPVTVTTIDFCQIKFVERENFMRLDRARQP